MGRKKEPIMKNTEKLDNGLRCKFCQTVFRGKVTATRMKAHFAKKSGYGIQICASVTSEAQAEALLAWNAIKRRDRSTSTPGRKKKSKVY